MFFFVLASANLAYTAHLNTLSPPHIMFSEMSVMSSCSRLQPYSESTLWGLQTLRGADLSLFTIWVFVLHPFEHVYIVSLAIVFFLFILFILTQSYAFMAYWRNKLWTIEKQATLSHFDFVKSVLPYNSILWQAVLFCFFYSDMLRLRKKCVVILFWCFFSFVEHFYSLPFKQY